MPKYFVSVECTGRTEIYDYDDVEAENEDEAVRIAMDKAALECDFDPDEINCTDIQELE